MTSLPRSLLAQDGPADIYLALAVLWDTRLADEARVVADGVDAPDFLDACGTATNEPSPGSLRIHKTEPKAGQP